MRIGGDRGARDLDEELRFHLDMRIEELVQAGMDPGIAVFALALGLLTGLLAGILPAVAGSRTAAAEVIREAGPHHSGSRWIRRLRSAMVVAQVALSVVLLAGAGVLLKSFVTTLRQDPGFDPARVVAFEISLPTYRYQDDASRLDFVDRLLDRVTALPAVEGTAVGRNLPISGSNMTSPVEIEGRGGGEDPAQIAWVSRDGTRPWASGPTPSSRPR